MHPTARLLTGTALAAASTGLASLYAATAASAATTAIATTTATATTATATAAVTATASAVSAATAVTTTAADDDRSFRVDVRCKDGKVIRGALKELCREPRGHVRSGVGGSVGPDTTQIAVGAALVAAATVGGTLHLRRRASGAQER